MQDMDDETRKAVLGEVIMDELKVIREYLKDVPIIKQRLTNIESDVSELKDDMKIVKAAVVDLSHNQKDHDRRISRLEAA